MIGGGSIASKAGLRVVLGLMEVPRLPPLHGFAWHMRLPLLNAGMEGRLHESGTSHEIGTLSFVNAAEMPVST